MYLGSVALVELYRIMKYVVVGIIAKDDFLILIFGLILNLSTVVSRLLTTRRYHTSWGKLCDSIKVSEEMGTMLINVVVVALTLRMVGRLPLFLRAW